MIPILYESTETEFDNNGLGRLRDAISGTVTEERNSIYECDFSYPVNGRNYDQIRLGRIIACEHDDTGDVQPFEIVSASRPISGIVEFHAVHISYRQSKLTVAGTNINSLADAFTLLGQAQPSNPFTYWTDQTGATGYMSAADGIPRTVRQLLGGVEGSILDTYRGEYEWDKFSVRLWNQRGRERDFTIRYGVNLSQYQDDTDYSESYVSCIPYWSGTDENGNEVIVTGNKVSSGYSSYNGIESCVPLDLSDKFENPPTTAEVEAAALSYMTSNQTYLPQQSIKVDFIRLQDSVEFAQYANLFECRLCDTIRVIFPQYNIDGKFKIVKTVYNVLQEKYDEVELGTTSVSLAEALGLEKRSMQ